jgi:hypothetical protein
VPALRQRIHAAHVARRPASHTRVARARQLGRLSRVRIRNVAARARFTQPQRRVVSAERRGAVLQVLTTSQKLAHRIVHELRKAFRGRAQYAWSPTDGSLLATWERES